MRDDYAAEADDEDVIKPDNVLYIIIALESKRSLTQSSRLKKKTHTIPTFL